MASFSRLAGMSLAGSPRFAIPVGAAVSGVASSSCMTSLKAACSSCAWAMVYMCFSVFNDSFYVGQQGLQLPDNPRHGVRHGI